MSQEITDWAVYKSCKVCGVEAGKPCISTSLLTTKGKGVELSAPHRRRESK